MNYKPEMQKIVTEEEYRVRMKYLSDLYDKWLQTRSDADLRKAAEEYLNANVENVEGDEDFDILRNLMNCWGKDHIDGMHDLYDEIPEEVWNEMVKIIFG